MIGNINCQELKGTKRDILLEDLCCDWHCGVHRIGDDSHPCLWTILGNAFTQGLHNSCEDQFAFSIHDVLLLISNQHNESHACKSSKSSDA